MRSPLKNGNVITPFEPAQVAEILSSNSFTLIEKSLRVRSIAPAQFIVHNNGSQSPVDEQNAATAPCRSIIGLSALANNVPDVPRLIVIRPVLTLPVPIAAIILSPPPLATGIPTGRPNIEAAFACNCPIGASAATKDGTTLARSLSGSTAASIPLCHVRRRMSSMPVPEASPHSIARSPVK